MQTHSTITTAMQRDEREPASRTGAIPAHARFARAARNRHKWLHAAAVFALLSGCATVRTHVTPEGDMVLVREDVKIRVPTRTMKIHQSRVGGVLIDPYVFAESETTGLTLSAALEEAVEGDCLEYHWARLMTMPAFNPENVRRGIRGQFHVVEFTLPQSSDPRLDQRNAIGCVTLEGTTAFVHVAKVGYSGQDQRFFMEVFEQARMESR